MFTMARYLRDLYRKVLGGLNNRPDRQSDRTDSDHDDIIVVEGQKEIPVIEIPRQISEVEIEDEEDDDDEDVALAEEEDDVEQVSEEEEEEEDVELVEEQVEVEDDELEEVVVEEEEEVTLEKEKESDVAEEEEAESGHRLDEPETGPLEIVSSDLCTP